MDFTHFLSSHMLDPRIGGKRLYQTVVEQALHAEACGYDGVGIPEHHLVNILLIPSPLQMAVKIAAHTKRVKLVTSICQLPIRDMRVFAGEVPEFRRAGGDSAACNEAAQNALGQSCNNPMALGYTPPTGYKEVKFRKYSKALVFAAQLDQLMAAEHVSLDELRCAVAILENLHP